MHIALETAGGADKYPAKAHAQRVADKLGVANGLIILEAARAELWPDSDEPRPFRQHRNFFYLSGCNEPDTFLTYNISDDRLVLWLPEIDESRVVWTGRGSTVEEALAKYDVDDARYWHHDSIESIAAGFGISAELTFALRNDPAGHSDNGIALEEAMNACRVIKDEHEIALIQQANDITGKAHREVMRRLHSFTNEAEVEAAYTAICIANHAKGQAYAPIAGSGPNASTLHYDGNSADFPHGQTLVLDAGCEVSCYASDVTRTMPLNPSNAGTWPSDEARQIYALVEKAQEACIKRMVPGTDFNTITALAVTIIVDGLLELGILHGKRKQIIEQGTYRGFFPHGLGHHLGLDVHDVSPSARSSATSASFRDILPRKAFSKVPSCPRVNSIAQEMILEPRMVMTIEPGVYFNRPLLEMFYKDPDHRRYIDLEVAHRYMGKLGGVRIEDDILITKTGYENMTTAPKGEKMLQLIKDGAAS